MPYGKMTEGDQRGGRNLEKERSRGKEGRTDGWVKLALPLSPHLLLLGFIYF